MIQDMCEHADTCLCEETNFVTKKLEKKRSNMTKIASQQL